MNRTKIEWVKNPDGTQGYTWNPITGCLNGCSYCYARKLANGRLKAKYLANDNIAPEIITKEPIPKKVEYDVNAISQPIRSLKDPFYPRFWPEKLEAMQSRNRDVCEGHKFNRRGYFCCDMSDLFGIGVPEEWTVEILDTIRASLDRFYLLTKQPQNLQKFSPLPDNCWVGVSVTGRSKPSFTDAILALEKIEAKIKYISIEPFLHWDYRNIAWLLKKQGYYHGFQNRLRVLDWIIIGAQTKPYNPPKIEWVQEIIKVADKAGVPAFLKDNLSPIFAKNDCKLFTEYRDIMFTLKDFESTGTRWHLRQEVPNG